MSVVEPERIRADDFLRWAVKQPDWFELVHGRIVGARTGARQSHAVVAGNVLVALAQHVRRGGFRVTARGTAVRTGRYGIRYPDVVVDSGPLEPDALAAGVPVLVMEVSISGASLVDVSDRLDEYLAHPDIRLIAFVDPENVSLKLYRRGVRDEWLVERYGALSETIVLPEIGAELALKDVYDSVRPADRLRPLSV